MAESGRATHARNSPRLKCRTDLERNNADVIVLAMTSLAQLPSLGTQMARASGNRVSFWVANLPEALGPNSLHLTKSAPYPEEESSKYAGPLARPGGHLCPPWLWENASRGDRICERYSRHLVDVKCITLHLVFYAFPARIKRVNPLRSAKFSGPDEASESQCHLVGEPCANTLFAGRLSALR